MFDDNFGKCGPIFKILSLVSTFYNLYFMTFYHYIRQLYYFLLYLYYLFLTAFCLPFYIILMNEWMDDNETIVEQQFM